MSQLPKRTELVTASASLTDYTTTYAGEFAGKYISAALLSGQTLAQQAVTILPNIKYKQVLQNVTPSSLIQDASCDFSETADAMSLSETILQPNELQVNLELCKKDFVPNWQALEMGFSAFHTLPKSITDYIIALTAEKVAEEIEQHIWQGDDSATSGLNKFEGFEQRLLGSDDVTDVSYSAVTASNVVDQLGAVVDGLPSAVYSSPDVAIYAATNVVQKYQRALGGFAAIGTLGTLPGTPDTNAVGTTAIPAGNSYQNQMSVGVKPLDFEGIKIFHCPGLSNNTIIGAQKSNLFFGTGLLNDTNEVRIVDVSQYDGSQNVRMIMRFTAGTQVGTFGDVVLHHASA